MDFLGEERSKSYMQYDARVPQPKNSLSGKTAGRVGGSADKQASGVQKKFAVFDIDGTLIRWQLYHAVANQMAKDGLFGEGVYERIKNARKKWKDRTHSSAFRDYEAELVSIFNDSLASIRVADFRQTAAEILEEYKSQTYVFTRDLIKKLKKQGYFLVAISGSPNELVETIANHYGFDDFIGSYYEEKDGFFTGKREIVAMAKAKYLKQMIEKHGLDERDSIAVGDTTGDVELFENAQNPIAFNPEAELYKIARQRGWKIVVERKNVIYELEAEDGKYILAETD